MKKIERLLALILVFAMALTIFPAAAFVEEVSAEIPEAPTGDADPSVSLPETNEENTEPPETMDSGDPTETYSPVPPYEDTEAAAETEVTVSEDGKPTLPIESDPIDAPQETESAESEEAVESEDSEESEEDIEGLTPVTSLNAVLDNYKVQFTINAETCEEFSLDANLTVDEDEATYETLEEICIQYDIPNILSYFSFQLGANIPFMYEQTTVELHFEEPFLWAIDESSIFVFQQTPEGFVPISNLAFISDDNCIEHLSIQPNVNGFNTQYVIITTDRPSTLAELGTQVAYMACNTVGNARVGLSGNGISFTTSGIMWHYISDQKRPALCLEPNKTFQTSNARVYQVETTTLNGSSSGSVGGSVWNRLTYDQRRLIALIALYGVETHWDSSYGNGGFNTGYNLQWPDNPNQCLFAAQQIMVWEVVTGNRSATYPYTCYNSSLINAFSGGIPGKYAWLESQLRAHDTATSTIPSPENSTYRLAWLSSGYQTVMQLMDVQYETPTPPTATLTVQKTSANATGSYANQAFTFKVFSDSNLTSQVGSTQYLYPGQWFSVTLDSGKTYYVAEVAEAGWSCTNSNANVKTVNGVTYYYQAITLTAGNIHTVRFNNEPIIRKNVSLSKSINSTSECIDMIKNNAMYSLSGAEYTIYRNGVAQEVITTDAAGNAVSALTYVVGDTLTVKETKAPAGFKLDTNTYTLTIINGENSISVSDVPLFDPPFVMTKVDADTTQPQGNASFSGAVFKWEYYDNPSWTGTAKATWYLATNKDGRVQYLPEYLASGYTSDPLYHPTADSYQLPLGSLKITEVKNSLGYTVIQEPLYCTILQDSTSSIGVSVNWKAESLQTLINIASGNYGIPEPIDTALFGSVTVQKLDRETGTDPQGAASFSGAEFEIINRSANAVKIGKTVVAPGEVCMVITADTMGTAVSTNLLPIGSYTLRETKAPAGYTLNSEWKQDFSVTESQKDFTFSISDNTGCMDSVIRGGIKIIKQDAEALANTNEETPLDGITFSVISENENPVVVGGKTYVKGDTVLTMAIKWTGTEWAAETAKDALPYGNYSVRENPQIAGGSMANECYSLNTEVVSVSIRNAEEIITRTFVNTQKPAPDGLIRILKVNETGERLPGAVFLLEWSKDGSSWQPVTKCDGVGVSGGCTSDGLSDGKLVSNSQGMVEFTGLNAEDYYRVTEVQTPAGYVLLSKAVFNGKLPQDTVQVSLRVVNTHNFQLPQTGSRSMAIISAALALFLTAGCCLLLPRKKKA